jgi:hypothetical protein
MRTWPLFVGRQAVFVASAEKASGPAVPLFVLVVIFIVILYVGLRIVLGRMNRNSKVQHFEEYRKFRDVRNAADKAAQAEGPANLPSDPAEAMDELARRNEEK